MSSCDYDTELMLDEAERAQDGRFGSLHALLGWYFAAGERFGSPQSMTLPQATAPGGRVVVRPQVDGGVGSSLDDNLAQLASVHAEVTRLAAEREDLFKVIVLRHRGFLGPTPPPGWEPSRRAGKKGAMTFDEVAKALGMTKEPVWRRANDAERLLKERFRALGLLR